MGEDYSQATDEQKSLIGKLLGWCLSNKLIVGLAVVFVCLLGVAVAPPPPLVLPAKP